MLAPCTIHTHLPRSAALMFSREELSHGPAPSPCQSRLGGLTCGARKRAPSSPVAPVATRASQPAQAPPLVSVWARPLQWDLLLVLSESARVSEAATTKTSGDRRPVMAGPGPKCTAARLAVAWTVPAGSGPGPANAGVTPTRSVPDSAVTAARSPPPATSDRERCHGRCRRRPRTSAQPTPRDLQRTARAACLKHACLTAMAAWLPAFSGYRR
jgi:hypothetical protein